MPKSQKSNPSNPKFPMNNLDEDKLDSIDMDFFELFEVLNVKEIVKLLNAVGGNFSQSDGNTIKKLVEFLRILDDDQIDDLIEAFDTIMRGE